MQGPKFRYYFKEAGGLFVAYTPHYGVELKQAPVYVENAPKEWQNLSAGYARSTDRKYRGVFTKYAEKLIYVGDGKKIIDYYAAYYGIQDELYFYIEVQENKHLSYVPYFDGKVNFEKYNYANTLSNADIIDSDVFEILEANNDVQYEIELTDSNSSYIQLDGVGLSFITNWNVENSINATASAYSGDHIIQCKVKDTQDVGQRSSTRQNGVSLPGGLPPTTNYMYIAKTQRTILVEYDFKVLAVHANSGSLVSSQVALAIGLQRFDIAQTPIALYSMLPNVLGTTNVYGSNPTSGKIHHVQGQFSITLNTDDTIYPVLNVEGIPASAFFYYQDFDQNSFIRFTSVAPEKAPTKHRGIRPLKLWNELVKKATDNKFSGIGNYLETSNNLLLVPGSSLRQDDKVSVKTTLGEFIKFCYVNLLATIVNKGKDTVTMDSVESTYNTAQLDNLGHVRDLTWNFSNEHFIGQIKVGYPNIEIGRDLINGKYEFNQTNQFTTGLKKVKAEYDIVSPYHASMYAIEILRSKLSEQRTTDSEKENLVYIIDVEQNTNEIIYSGPAVVSGNNTITINTQFAIANGNYTLDYGNGNTTTISITNVSYLVVGSTIITVSGSITNGPYSSLSISDFNAALYHPKRPAYSSITGLLNNSKAFNLTISPAEILRLHMPIISGGIYNAISDPNLSVITFQSGDKNVNLSKTIGGVTVAENANVNLSDFGAPYYIPVEVTFTTDYDREFYNVMNSMDRYKLIPFVWKNRILRGFVSETSSQDGNYKERQFTLLLQNGTELINFIN